MWHTDAAGAVHPICRTEFSAKTLRYRYHCGSVSVGPWLGPNWPADRWYLAAGQLSRASARLDGAWKPSSRLSGGAEGKQALHVPRHGHQAPLTPDTVDPAQQKLPETHH